MNTNRKYDKFYNNNLHLKNKIINYNLYSKGKNHTFCKNIKSINNIIFFIISCNIMIIYPYFHKFFIYF